ncbi:granulocyte colony-stimulating factor receptor [Syngnathoides biaculeatus]|uniref:granulocyte colony-stimulating factor receptor n=1 Tax=Syngnathoides biaculeatus TaxID=300417 RepID=UPI002ADDF20C|nr:granulocyte colony-stimulating factor receptor [Syngnathoides biaculeatus]XP_061675848.1 granulocyte colony-stimulating factor receptor [Syngnathoides biaculeatus]
MAGAWMSVLVTLAAMNAAKYVADGQACASVYASSLAVTLGSPVTATCVINDDCPALAGQVRHDVEWRLDDRVLPGVIRVADGSGRPAYQVLIPAFNHSRATLTCCLGTSPGHIVGGLEIRAGYPPPVPQRPSCQANLSIPERLTCQWEASLPDTNLPTKYTLHTHIRDYFRDDHLNHTYELQPGDRSFTIPRSGFAFFSEMEIYVKAVNPLGEARSEPLTLEPVSSAKFDPPKIMKLQAWGLSCLRLRWDFQKHQVWMKDFVSLQVRFKTAANNLWDERPILNEMTPKRPMYQRGLLHGMQYMAQIRVRYQQSPWSEWSSSQSAVTLETAPTGTLDTWMRVIGDHMHKQRNMLLFWKPSERFRANGRNVSYVVSLLKASSERGKLCATAGNHCSFQVPRKARKVYLMALNAVGKSTPASVRIYHPKDGEAIFDISTTTRDNGSILVQWENIVSPTIVDYVVEWRPLFNNDLSFVHFEIAGRNLSSLVLAGIFEPYKPYGISVYPRFKDGIGPPRTCNAYSLQKAPSMVPKITIKKTWQYHVELTWDEIPLEQRNGIIQSYRLFYWDETKTVQVATGDLEERKVVLTGLNSLSVYDAVLMVSTYGGSSNGSMVQFDIKEMNPISSAMIVVGTSVAVFSVIIFMVILCSSKHNRLKVHFWPDVPDPANSSIKSWTSQSTQDIRSSWDSKEPNPIYLSHLSLLEIPQKPNKEDDVTAWLNNTEDSSDLGESLCDSPFIPGFSSSNSDSVPYATVIFPARHPHEYLRSESSQPLLESEELPSPKSYQNVDATEGSKCFFGLAKPEEEPQAATIQWEDFPFLRALAMNDTQ